MYMDAGIDSEAPRYCRGWVAQIPTSCRHYESFYDYTKPIHSVHTTTPKPNRLAATSKQAHFRLLARLLLRESMRRYCAVQSRGGMGACELPLWGRLTSGGSVVWRWRDVVAARAEKCGSCRHLAAFARMIWGVRAASNFFRGSVPLVRMARKRHRLICQIWPLAYGPAQGPEPGPHAHERSFRRGLASREKDQSAPRPRRSCVQPWARRAGLSAHGNAARDRPVQTRP